MYSQQDLIGNALLIFLMMAFGTFVVAIGAFGVRLYLLEHPSPQNTLLSRLLRRGPTAKTPSPVPAPLIDTSWSPLPTEQPTEQVLELSGNSSSSFCPTPESAVFSANDSSTHYESVYSPMGSHKMFALAWEADRVLGDIRARLEHDPCDECAVADLVSVGASTSILDNENHFMWSFSELMESLIDSGMFCKAGPGINDVVLVYCWGHWHFPKAPFALQHALKSRLDQLGQTPHIQHHGTVFRLLTNYRLKQPNNPQLNHVFGECVRTCCCNDYLAMMPMLTQAIELADANTKAFFYRNVLLLFQGHFDCCMRNYVEDGTGVKNLVQAYREPAVAKAVGAMCAWLGPRCDAVRAWHKEIEGDASYTAVHVNPTAKPRPVTPGGWRFL